MPSGSSQFGIAEVIAISLGIIVAAFVVTAVAWYVLSRRESQSLRVVLLDVSPLALGISALLVSLLVSALFGAGIGALAFLWGQATYSITKSTPQASSLPRWMARAGQIMGGLAVALWLLYTYLR